MFEFKVDYKGFIVGSILRPIVVTPLLRDAFIDYLKSIGKLGGKTKFLASPRPQNSGSVGRNMWVMNVELLSYICRVINFKKGMTTYKFTTKILEDGTIKLPKEAMFVDEEVLITITSKKAQTSEKSRTKAADFVKKWSGFLKDLDADDAKYHYLLEKHK